MNKITALFASTVARREICHQAKLTGSVKWLTTHLVCLALFAFLLPTNLMAQSLGCNPNYVNLNNGVLNVAPTGIDDTNNIQCALNAAKANGVPTVKLGTNDYLISHIQISDFRGTLEGTTKDDTTLVVINNSVDCDELIEAGQAPAGIKFIRGDARVRFLTYGAETPCFGSQSDVFFLIHFTSGNAYSDCAHDTGFGVVDRVNLLSLAPIFPGIRGVGAGAEGTYFGTCKSTLLGTFKLNRSLLGGLRVAAQLGIRGAGQVDINFNEFVDNAIGAGAINANQLLTVQENAIVRSEDADHDFFGVVLFTDEPDSPATNRLVLHNNEFSLVEGPNSNQNAAFFAGQDFKIANVSLVATNNEFNLQGDQVWGFLASDVSGGIFANNNIEGTADTGFAIEGDDITSMDWSVTGNSFHGLISGSADIVLGFGSAQTIIGPDQGAIIQDFGSDNVILNSSSQKLESTFNIGSEVTVARVETILPRLRHLKNKLGSLLSSSPELVAAAELNSAWLNDSRSLRGDIEPVTSISSLKDGIEKLMGSSLVED